MLNYTIDVYSNDIDENIYVTIEKIEVDDEYVNVFHNCETALYDCADFEIAISELVQFDVKFTEKMQQDSYFSRLEAV
jgi:hypothetical protein